MLAQKIYITVLVLFFSNFALGLKASKVNQFGGVVWGFDFKSESEIFLTLRSGKLYH